jgi:hypothetical protein
MAIFKIFPEKDTTIYSAYPALNAGRDEILEDSTTPGITSGSNGPQTSRILIKFPNSAINDVLNNQVSGSTFNVYLKLFLARAGNIPLDYTLYCYPLSQSWDMGTGKYSDVPNTTNGVSWKYLNYSGSSQWAISGGNATASYISTNPGGGVWYTSSAASQSFSYTSSKDVTFDVTNMVTRFYSGSLPNNGFIVKKQDSLEFNTSSYFDLKYFSMDTHTIYPPYLEFKWRDYTFNTGSSTNSFITSSDLIATLGNNAKEYNQNAIQRFRVNVRDKYPVRVFTTSSIYLQNKYLPTSSYYSIKDLDTNEVIVEFDNNYTQISADSNGNYFDVYMSGLEPERYYQILIKTIIGGNTLILSNNYYFKVKK